MYREREICISIQYMFIIIVSSSSNIIDVTTTNDIIISIILVMGRPSRWPRRLAWRTGGRPPMAPTACDIV